VRTIATLGLLGVVAVLVWQVLEAGASPDATTLGLLVLAIVTATAILQPRPFVAVLGRVRSVDILGLKVDLELRRVDEIKQRF
jgi:hypothetical protein